MKKFVAYLLMGFLVPSAAFACDEVKVLALNMYHEARGEGPDGKQMVGEVTLNRVASSRYPDNICDVVYQPKQFSWTHTRSDHSPHDHDLWNLSFDIAQGLLDGSLEKFGTESTHFLNPDRVSRIPNWAKEFEVDGRVGNHVFYIEG